MSIEEEVASAFEQVRGIGGSVRRPARVTHIIPADVDVAQVRARMNLSQQQFADKYGFPVSTVRNWEQGRRVPEGPARLLLKVIDDQPGAVEQYLVRSAGQVARG